jgi:hypothetical protein
MPLRCGFFGARGVRAVIRPRGRPVAERLVDRLDGGGWADERDRQQWSGLSRHGVLLDLVI